MQLVYSRSLFWKIFLPVGSLLVVCAIATAIFLPVMIQDSAEREAIAAGQETVKQYQVLRKYYTENVVKKILANGGYVMTTDHKTEPNGLPLPATMIHELSSLLQNTGTTLKLYSPYPFPNRKDRQLDAFANDAWAYFQSNPAKTFSRTEVLGDKTIVRVAMADRMVDQACVQCHNTLKSSPKTDWKLNDVRGVLEVASSKELDSGQRIINRVLGVFGLSMLLIAIFFRVFYQRSIAKPLHVALDTAHSLTEGSEEKLQALEAIANGNLTQEFLPAKVPQIDKKTISEDEVGSLLKSFLHLSEVQASLDQAFRKMTLSLQQGRTAEAERDWLKSSQNELNALMRGEHQSTDLAEGVLAYLVNRIGAAVGALYLFEEHSKELILMASFALMRRKRLSDRFALGEGLIGQAARERKSICLMQVPPDYLPISSALGEATPRNVIAIPLVHGEVLIGAIEIGAFKEFSDKELEFLELSREGIAIAFGVNRSRNLTQELLAQSQQQSEELRVQQEELQQTNEELHERAEVLERQREEIREKSEQIENTSREIQIKANQLEQANTYKSEFLANMSHELRTPLNSMLILSSLLKDNKDDNLTQKQIEYATTINAAGKDLLLLINDILDLSKVESGNVELQYEEVTLRELCLPLETLFQPLAEQKHLHFEIELTQAPSQLHIDLARTQQVLKNLISNGLKFTEQGSVTLKITSVAATASPLGVETIAFAVADTGIGIPLDKQKLVFEAFKQADGSINRKYGGTGLGLSISRQLVLKMGGDLRIQSEDGKGSLFTLYLPSAPNMTSGSASAVSGHLEAQSGSMLSTQAQAKSGQSAHTSALDIQAATRITAPTAQDDRQSLKTGDKCILIIEDDSNFANILMDFVRGHQFAALMATDGESGVSLARHFLPSAIILDVTLPRIDGWEVMRCLKDDPSTRHIPVHFITGVEDKKTAMEMGAVGFVTKPITVEQLTDVFATLEDALAKTVKKLLIVEDNPNELTSLIALLSEKNILISSAASGREAINMLSSDHFDCMVLDLGLSDMSGFEVLSHLQNGEDKYKVPVIVHSGRELSRDEERELRRFAESIIVKGAKSPERLLNEVSLFLHLVESKLPESKRRMIRATFNNETALEGKKILLVDDDMRNIFSLTSLLSERGLVVVEAENGVDALRRLSEHPDVALVLIDIMMPEMDGYTAMREIRKEARFAQLPIIAMTAKAMKGDHQKCLDAGASDYIAKPIETHKLLSLLRVWICRRT